MLTCRWNGLDRLHRVRVSPLVFGLLAILVLGAFAFILVGLVARPALADTGSQPDFEFIRYWTGTFSVYQGNPPLYGSVDVQGLNGFANTVNLTASVAPSLVDGPSVSLNHTSLVANPSTVVSVGLVVWVGIKAQPGEYNFTVTGTSGSLVHTTGFNMTVLQGPMPETDFSISLVESSVDLVPGGQGYFQLNLDKTSPSNLPELDVSLSTQITPTGGVTLLSFPSKLSVKADGIETIYYINASASAPAGQYVVNITATELPTWVTDWPWTHNVILVANIGASGISAPVGSLNVTVLGPNGPVEGANVTITSGPNGERMLVSATSGPDGTCIFSDLSPGNYTYEVTAHGYRVTQRTVTLGGGQSVSDSATLSQNAPPLSPSSPRVEYLLTGSGVAIAVLMGIVAFVRRKNRAS